MRLPHSIFYFRRKILEVYNSSSQVNHKQFHSSLSERFPLQDLEVDKHHNKRAKEDHFTLKNSHINSKETEETEFSNASSIHLGRCNNQAIGLKADKLHVEKKIITSLQDGDRENALILLQNQTLSLHNFANILRSCSELHDLTFALKSWNVMVARGIFPNAFCYRSMIQALCNNGYFEEAFSFLKSSGEGLPSCASIPAYNGLLKACLKVRNWSYAHQCLEFMEEKRVGKNEETYGLLAWIASYDNLASLNKVWEEYNSKFSCSMLPLTSFIISFSRLRDFNSAYQKLQRMIELFIRAMGQKSVLYSELDIPIPLKVHIVGDDIFSDEKSRYSDIAKTKIVSYSQNLTDNEDKLIVKLKRGFEEVMRVCTLANQYTLTERLMLQMQHLGLQPTAKIYHIYLKAMLQQKRNDDALEIFKLMKSRNIQPLRLSFMSMSIGCSDNSELDMAEKFIEQVSNPRAPNYVNKFLTACERMNLCERGLQAFHKMREKNVRPNVRTYELLLSLCLNVNAPYETGNTHSQLECLKRWKAIEIDMARNRVEHNHWLMMCLVKAFAEEGMRNELRFYLPRALELFRLIRNENTAVVVYTVVIHALINAKERDLAVETYKNMRANGYKPDGVLYTILIYLFGLIGSFKSALAVVSLMIRDGYGYWPDSYSNFFTFVDLKEALYITNKMIGEKTKPSVAAYNGLLQRAANEGNLQVMEHILEKMNRSETEPDISTCTTVFSAYCAHEFYYTAFEALQVLCFRMIGLGDAVRSEKFFRYADNYVFEEDSQPEMNLLTRFDDEVAFTLLMMRWSAVSGFPVCWALDNSVWASRTSSSFEDIHIISV